MARDTNLWKRNLLVIPGGLLAFFSGLALFYFLTIRQSGAPCGKYTAVLISGTCYTTTGFLAGVLLVGIILIAVGLAVFRGKPVALVDHLHHGTPAHFGLALLGSLVAIPIIVYGAVLYLERARGTVFVMRVPGSAASAGANITLHAVLGAVLLIGLLAFIPYILLYIAQGQLRRRFLLVAETYEEPEAAFPGEPAVPGEASSTVVQETIITTGAATPPPEEFVDEALWPASRDGPEVEAAKPEPVEDMEGWSPAPAAAPGTAPKPRRPTAPSVQPAPIVHQAPGCRAMGNNGAECGEPVGPGGRYCLRHACQGRTATGSPCRNPALEGGSRCRAHSAS